MSCNNKAMIFEAFNAIIDDLDARESVKLSGDYCPFDTVDPKDGYNIHEIRMISNWRANVTVQFATRAVKQNDFYKDGSPCYRGMDEEYFHYSFDKKEVLSQYEYDARAKRQNQLWDILDSILDGFKKEYGKGASLPEDFVRSGIRENEEKYSLTEEEKSWLLKETMEEWNREDEDEYEEDD